MSNEDEDPIEADNDDEHAMEETSDSEEVEAIVETSEDMEVNDIEPTSTAEVEAEAEATDDGESSIKPVASDQQQQEQQPTVLVETAAASIVDDTMADADIATPTAVSSASEVLTAVVIEEGRPQKLDVVRKKPGPKKSVSKLHKGRLTTQQVAKDARDMLLHTVQRLPLALSETYTVRSFGKLDPPYATPHNLYPVGFSCDRFEFSPVHGRILKMRCTILDGKKLREKQRELDMPVTAPEGPLFRIMWGEGVDDDGEGGMGEYPYDPFSREEPSPEEGMRVRVRYEHDQWYTGTIVEVSAYGIADDQVEIKIQYDDGSTEDAVFPDPDISIYLPGSEDEAMEDGTIEFTEVNGKPVTSIVGRSPIEAWGNMLLKLGLIDEVIFETALNELRAAHRKEPSEEKKSSEDDDMDVEEPTTEENELRKQVEALKEELKEERIKEREAAVALADARVACLGPFFCNPFQDKDQMKAQVHSWLSTIIRKEKTKMGSLGNKKKVVTPTDLLDRNDTFFNSDIEALVEGQPGSENIPEYVFQAFRGGVVSGLLESWQQQAQERRQEKKKEQKPNKAFSFSPKAPAASSSSASKSKSSSEKEKERKRQIREEANEARKKQRQEELDMKKRARAEERMARLSVQVDERLQRESSSQREKVILAMAKSFFKENSTRRKAAELVTGQRVLDDSLRKPLSSDDSSPVALSPLCTKFDEDVLRVWDFFTSYGESMKKWGYLSSIPTLEKLQEAIDALKDDKTEKKNLPAASMDRQQAVHFLSALCVSLCKPLAVSLTRLLFASLIALNPTLQKDFGAAFFQDVRASLDKDGRDAKGGKDGKNGKDKPEDENEDEDEEKKEGPCASDLLQVNMWNWREIARLTFLSDALGELGYQKHEIAHQLRGYRSMGHPNSKEAKRLKRTEDFPISVLRQVISQESRCKKFGMLSLEDHRVRILAPSSPSVEPDDWKFHLHNVKAVSVKKIDLMKTNITKSIELLQADKSVDLASKKDIIADLEKSLELSGTVREESAQDNKAILQEAKAIVLKVLEAATGDIFSSNSSKKVFQKDLKASSSASRSEKPPNRSRIESYGDLQRPMMGMSRSLEISLPKYKELAHKRQEYMEAALTLKEEIEKKDKVDEDDDDDDDDDENGDKKKHAESSSDKDGKDENGGDKEATEATIRKEGKADNGSEEVVAMVVENGPDTGKVEAEATKIGKETPYDEFCGDIPSAPELIRRCLAVLRTVAQTNAAEHFIYPVDPQTNPGYYESILRPMCLHETGVRLQEAAKSVGLINADARAEFLDTVIADFGRNVRLISQNCSCYANAGATVIAAGDELLRIFERLFFDWVLAPVDLLPPLENLDDDKCVEFHVSDDDSLVLLCDGCEGKYNMSRLNPPLKEVPKGDWFCPRCLSGRAWVTLDPRLGKSIPDEKNGREGEVTRVKFVYPEESGSVTQICYDVVYPSGQKVCLSLEEVDQELKRQGISVSAVRCIEALSESPGYSRGANRLLYENPVPVLSNPFVSDAAAQAFTSGSAYRDVLSGSSTLLLVDAEDMLGSEWSRLMSLLVTECAASELMLELASKLEGDSATGMQALRTQSQKKVDIVDVLQLPPLLKEFDEAEKAAKEKGKPAKEENGDAAVVVDANTIEVVADVKVESVDVPKDVIVNGDTPVPDAVLSEELALKQERAAILEERERRQKIREESIAAFVLKNQLRSTIASFEEDYVSQSVDNCLGSTERGLNLASSRCRTTSCHYCGLSDSALGSPLMRTPTKEEWDEIMPHFARKRKVYLVADVGGHKSEAESASTKKGKKRDFVAVKVYVGEELFSCEMDEDDDTEVSQNIKDGGMMEFLPRNPDGAQNELEFRARANLPFVTGSLSVHECCAVAAHNARKERAIQQHKEAKSAAFEFASGMMCGRTLSLGRDLAGRSYWKFNANSRELFVCEGGSDKIWRCYKDPAVIASIIHNLEGDPVTTALKEAYEDAGALLPLNRWRSLVLKRQFELAPDQPSEVDRGKPKKSDEDEEEDYPFEVGEAVLVESSCSRMLWDATVMAVSQVNGKVNGKVNGYRVHYKGWSTRFDNWVESSRVVEPNENNIQVQEEMVEELQKKKSLLDVPKNKFLRGLSAKAYLEAPNRARGNLCPPDFVEVATAPPGSSSGLETFHLIKAALLMMEAALPVGSVDTSPRGDWRPEYSAAWRQAVIESAGPYTLMACVYYFEESVLPDWIDQHVAHVMSSLPQRWKAIREASYASLALRVSMLDMALDYETVQFKKSKSRR